MFSSERSVIIAFCTVVCSISSELKQFKPDQFIEAPLQNQCKYYFDLGACFCLSLFCLHLHSNICWNLIVQTIIKSSIEYFISNPILHSYFINRRRKTYKKSNPRLVFVCKLAGMKKYPGSLWDIIVSMVASSIAIWVATFYPALTWAGMAANVRDFATLSAKWTDDVKVQHSMFLINFGEMCRKRENQFHNIFGVITIYCRRKRRN